MAKDGILVTGGAGYIGSHCVKQMINHQRRVVVLDNLSTGYGQFIFGDLFIEGDISDTDLVSRILKEYDIGAVMHFAAHAYVGESVEDPEKYYRNNVGGTLSLLSAMKANRVRQLIFSSSCAVYGVPETVPITEDLPLNPINPYGFTKRVVEEMLSDFSRAYGLKYVSLRYFNAAGADSEGELGEAHEPETHLIPLVFQAIQGRREYIAVYGTDYETPDGTCIRDYIHIDDIAKAHRLSLEYLEQGGKSDVFNIGTEQGHSVHEIIQACERVAGRRPHVVEAKRRPGDPPVLVASSEKIRRVLGWEPDYKSLDAIIKTAWDWENVRAAILS